MTNLITPLTFFAALVIGCLGAYFAHKRGRNLYVWFLIGFFFGILGLMIIFFASNRKTKPVPTTTIQGPGDKFWYYLDHTHQQVGPMSFHTFSASWKQGKISPSTYVWHEELSEWKHLQDLLITVPPQDKGAQQEAR